MSRALAVHASDYPGSFANPEPVITVRVRGFLVGGELVAAIDENGNEFPIIGVTPGRVRSCVGCGRRVYLPDEAEEASLPCPFTDCGVAIPTAPLFGDELMDDAPAVMIAGRCPEHGAACAPVERDA